MVVDLSGELCPLPNSVATVVGSRWAGSHFREMVELDVGWVHVVDPVFDPSVCSRIEVPFSRSDSLVRSFAWPLSSTSILLASLYHPRLSQVTYSFLLATCESFPSIHISYPILITFQTKVLDGLNENCLCKPPSNRVSHLNRERQVENFVVKQGPYQAL